MPRNPLKAAMVRLNKQKTPRDMVNRAKKSSKEKRGAPLSAKSHGFSVRDALEAAGTRSKVDIDRSKKRETKMSKRKGK